MVGSFVQRNRLSIPFRGGVNVLLYTFTLFLMKSGKFVSPGGQNCAWNRSDAEKKTVVLSFACGDSSPILNCRENLSLWRGTSNTANLIGDKRCTDRRISWLSQHGNAAELLCGRNKKNENVGKSSWSLATMRTMRMRVNVVMKITTIMRAT